MPPDEGGAGHTPAPGHHHQHLQGNASGFTRHDGAGDGGRGSNIPPDIVCPHCGPCICCPHTRYYVKPGPSVPNGTVDERESLGFTERLRAQRDETKAPTPPTPAGLAGTAAPGTKPHYVADAIGKELTTLASTPEGSRNATLNTVALKIFGFVKGGHADKQACWDELKRIGGAIGLTDSEMVGATGTAGTLGSAWNAATPRSVPAPGLAMRVLEVNAAELAPKAPL